MLDVKRNLTTMTDFYELTMSAGYLDEGYVDKIAVFDMFFRRVPDGGGYAIAAGLDQLIDYIEDLRRGSPEIYRRGHRLSALDEGVRREVPHLSCQLQAALQYLGH